MYAMSFHQGHDAALALVGEGKIWHFEKERFTGIKHDNGSMLSFQEACLEIAGVRSADVAATADFYAEDPARIERKSKNVSLHHHFAHAAYSFYTSGFEVARVFTLDGGGGNHWEADEIKITNATVGQFRQPFGSAALEFSLRPFLDTAGIGAGWSGLGLDVCGDVHGAGTAMALGTARGEHPLRGRIRRHQQDTTMVFAQQAGLAGPSDLPLVISGGCALNGIASYALLQAGMTRRLHVPPAVYDGGLAVGAALYALHGALGVPRVQYAPAAVAYAGWPGPDLIDAETAARVADLVANGRVVGVFQGRAESGPRALGHRSILADPTRADMRNRINAIKGRQPYRPVAPAMTAEFAAEHFELLDPDAYSYMTCIASARPSASRLVPAGLHDDGTARIQVVMPESGLVGVIEALVARGRPACVLNTSFNPRGQAIVHTPEDARAMARQLGLDAVVVGNELEALS